MTEIEENKINSLLHEGRVFYPSRETRTCGEIRSMEEYRLIYRKSIEDPEGFWGEKAEQLDWFTKWDKVLDADFPAAKHEWFIGGKLNVSYNCVDRHLNSWRKNKAALIWEGDNGDSKTLTYQQLYFEINRFANVLKNLGIKKGDCVAIYLPMVMELPIAMLACARIGAIHNVVFSGFSAVALRERMLNSQAKLLICSDGYYRGGNVIKSKSVADEALKDCPNVKSAVMVKRADIAVTMEPGRDHLWNDLMNNRENDKPCPPEILDSEDPLFILYTSGSTGKPKGVLHTQAGYLLYVYLTFRWIFDYKEEDTFWCTADIGWITGHSYSIYGPLSNGATSIIFEGIPNYSNPDRYWSIIERYRASIFYTSPTAIRSIMKDGDEWPKKHDLGSLRILGSVGEVINPEVWMWYYNVIGDGKCPIVDTWWQTETGGIAISPFPCATPLKPGSATLPFPGIDAAILREDGTTADVNEGGNLVIRKPWPGLMRQIYGEPERFKNVYFTRFPGVYNTGDEARKDDDGYIWLMGRLDDVIKVSGHRIGANEIESAMVAHPAVAEAAVVGTPHPIKGQGIYAFVTLKTGIVKTEDLKKELTEWVRKQIGPIATPDKIQFADNLPKTRSGKIMRRILTKISAGQFDEFGDTSTLADPSVLETLVRERE